MKLSANSLEARDVPGGDTPESEAFRAGSVGVRVVGREIPHACGEIRAVRQSRGRAHSIHLRRFVPGPDFATRPWQEATVFNSNSQSGTTKPASYEPVHSECVPLPFDPVSRTRSVTGIDVRTLAPGTEVSMDTVNSHYRFVILDNGGRRALVHGGHYFDGEAEARIEGSTLGGTLLWAGWIAEGLCLELSVQGKRLSTSRVRSIAITTAPRPA